tara:strand:+ start:8696 stop:9019 length:324 start_codon:yes stop_codon:yes gene_type:complete
MPSPRLLSQRGNLKVLMHPAEGGEFLIQHTENVSGALEHNKQLQTAGHDGWTSKQRELRHAAHIPSIVMMKWKAEGIDVLNPDHAPQVARKLNSSEWKHLRAAEFRI